MTIDNALQERIFRFMSAVNKIRGNEKPMTVGITGSSGFIGSSLIPFLTTGGHRVIRFIRQPSSRDDNCNQQNVKSIEWDPSLAYVDASSLNDKIGNNLDAVVNLAGRKYIWKMDKGKEKEDL